LKIKEIKFNGSKALDYKDFCKVVEIVKNKQHKKIEGMNKILSIVEGMNSKR